MQAAFLRLQQGSHYKCVVNVNRDECVLENWSDFESEDSDVCSEGGEESEDSAEESAEDSEESSADEDDLPDSWRSVDIFICSEKKALQYRIYSSSSNHSYNCS